MNVKDYEYEVNATLSGGSGLRLTDLVQQMSWGDSAGELAARADFTLAQIKTADGYLSDLLKLCTRISISANGETVFEGTTWEWEYQSGSERFVKILAYDPLIYMTKCKDNSYYSSGKSTQAIVSDICSRWEIPLDYRWGSISHQKTVYNAMSIADQISQTVAEAERQLGKNSVMLFKAGALLIDKKGANKDVYVFEAANNAISTANRLTLDGLVTKVIIVGKEDEDGRLPVEKTVEGKTEYGTLQEIVIRTGDTTLDEAAAEADKIIEERGKPSEYITVEAPDVPSIRKSDRVRIIAGNLSGFFIVKGITHRAHERKMSMELERADIVK